MGSRLGRKVVHFANLPIKTIPSSTKIEIKRVLESLYGFEVEKVETLNMEGKKKKRGLLIAKPDYKKAYVTLRNPLSISSELYRIRLIQEDKESMNKRQAKPSIVEDGEVKSHWLDDDKRGENKKHEKGYNTRSGHDNGARRGNDAFRGNNRNTAGRDAGTDKFPWSNMRSSN